MVYVWAGVIALSLIIEIASNQLISIWFSLGALVSMILAACGAGIYWQIPVFVVVSLVALIATRPLLKKFLKKPIERTNADSIVGKTTVTLSDTVDGITSVKFGGIVWTAKSSEEIKAGTKISVVQIEGNTLHIVKAN